MARDLQEVLRAVVDAWEDQDMRALAQLTDDQLEAQTQARGVVREFVEDYWDREVAAKHAVTDAPEGQVVAGLVDLLQTMEHCAAAVRSARLDALDDV